MTPNPENQKCVDCGKTYNEGKGEFHNQQNCLAYEQDEKGHYIKKKDFKKKKSEED